MARPSLASMSPGIVAAFAFILSLFAGAYCKFLSFAASSAAEDGGVVDSVELSFGIWYYQGWTVVQDNVRGNVVLETCMNYPSGTYRDGKWKSAQAFSTMALILGGVVTFWALLAGWLYPSKQTYRRGGMAYMLCCLFQGLSLLFLDSNACHENSLLASLQDSAPSLTFSSCSMAAGGKCAIASTVLWFAAAVLALKVDPPVRSPITTQTHDVTYTKTTGPDGTTMVSENVVKGEPVPLGGGGQPEAEEALLQQEQAV